jgi:RPA family protein
VTGREPAWRVLAQELEASLEEEKGVGERAASYLLSPLGARMNRVLVSGTLGPAEAVGRDPENPFFRARLVDPTGTVTVTAGGFQPRAMATLREVTSPTPAVVVGKVNLFRGRDGTAYVSVRAETVRPASIEEVRGHLADAVEQTTERIRLVEAIRSEQSGAPAPLAKFPAPWVRSAREASRRYPGVDPDNFRGPLTGAIQVVAGTAPLPMPAVAAVPIPAEPPRAPASLPSAKIIRTGPPPPPSAPSASERAEESAFLDVIDQLSGQSADGYADLKEVVRAAARTGVTSQRAEELLGRLEESGAVEEPIVGKLRRA